MPFLDLTRQGGQLRRQLQSAASGVIKRGLFALGPEVRCFEDEWGRYNDSLCVCVGSGTDALTLALFASGVICEGGGHEVITTPLTAGYTALAILNAGATPVFADVEKDTYTLDPLSVERAITPKTRAIIPVHLYGQMADMRRLRAIADQYNLMIIEDAAQAHGAALHDSRPGQYGNAAAFSFYPTKNLGALGDGGAVISRDPEFIERLKILRQGGHLDAMVGTQEGRNSRLDEIQAAFLRAKLPYLNEWNERRRTLAAVYDAALGSVPGLRTPIRRSDRGQSHHLYVIQHPERDRLRIFLERQGIETLIHYPFLLHRQPLFRREGQTALLIAESLHPNLLSLPLYPELSEAEVETIVEAVRRF